MFIDDVYSNGKKSDGDYPLLSTAIAEGLFHPRCKDSTSTHYPELDDLSGPLSDDELAELDRQRGLEVQQQHAEKQAERFDRRAKYSLDEDNKKFAKARADEWHDRADMLEEKVKKAENINKISSEGVAKLTESDIIKTKKPLEINIQLFAKIPKEKFTMYALDPVKQPDKAKAFKEALGYTKENYQDLIDNIQNNFKENFMVLKNEDKFGKRYEYVMELTVANGRKANVCTGWIKENDSSEPRMTSAYVTKKKVTPNES